MLLSCNNLKLCERNYFKELSFLKLLVSYIEWITEQLVANVPTYKYT